MDQTGRGGERGPGARARSARRRAGILAVVAALGAAILAAPMPAGSAGGGCGTRYERYFAGHGTSEAFSTAAVGDVLGHGRPQVVVGGMDGWVRIWDTDATTLLRCLDAGDGAVQASPALVDLTGDGILDVLVANQGTGWVIGFDGPTGAEVFAAHDHAEPLAGFQATPTVADLTGDGRPEVIAASLDHHLHAWQLDGTPAPGFPVFLYDTLWSSPAVADLTGDGRPEIVVGGDMAPDNPATEVYAPGGLLWVLGADGQPLPGFPRWFPAEHGHNVVWSSPAIGDVDGDGAPEIAVGSGLFWPHGHGHRVHVVEADAADAPGWEGGVDVGSRVMASPALADLDGSGAGLDVVVLTEAGVVVALGPDGTTRWQRCNLRDPGACRPGYGVHGQVAVADVDGDGVQEVASMAEQVMRLLDGRTGEVAWERYVAEVWPPPAAPSVAEVDGRATVYQAVVLNTAEDGDRGPGDSPVVLRFVLDAPLGRADWPTFHHDLARTGAAG